MNVDLKVVLFCFMCWGRPSADWFFVTGACARPADVRCHDDHDPRVALFVSMTRASPVGACGFVVQVFVSAGTQLAYTCPRPLQPFSLKRNGDKAAANRGG